MDKRISWHIEKRNLSDLKPYEKNPRIITEYGLNQLKESFDEIGFAQPININTDGTILSGHARCIQLGKEGTIEVDVYVPDRLLTPKQEEAVIIRMNKNVAGTWDYEVLANQFEMSELEEWGFSTADFPKALEPEDFSNKNSEIDTENFGNDLQHTCPKCGFEFNE